VTGSTSVVVLAVAIASYLGTWSIPEKNKIVKQKSKAVVVIEQFSLRASKNISNTVHFRDNVTKEH